MQRITSLLYLAITACAADPTEPLPIPPRPPGGVIDPGGAPDEPRQCLAVPTGRALFGTSADEELRGVAITRTGTILTVGYDRASFSPHGLVGGRGIVLELAPDLAGMSQVGVLDSAGTDSLESISIAPDTGKIWVVGRTNGDLPDLPGHGGFDWVVGEVTPAGGVARLARGLESTSEHAHRLSAGTGGLLAIAGHEQRTGADGASSMDPFLAVYDARDGSASPLWFTSRRGAADEATAPSTPVTRGSSRAAPSSTATNKAPS